MENPKKHTAFDRRKILVIVLAVIFALLLVVALMLPDAPQNDGGATEAPTSGATAPAGGMQELIIQSLKEEGDLVLISTTYGDFSYPFAYSDLLVIDTLTEKDHVALLFKVNLVDSIEPVFTLWINREQGTEAGALQVENRSYPLYVEIIPAREDLDPGCRQSFNAAQELLNDVLRSLEENGYYIP